MSRPQYFFTNSLPRLVVPIGDPAGIGPEVVLKAIPGLADRCQITLVGSRRLLRELHQNLGGADPEQFPLIDVPCLGPIVPGQASAASGQASFSYLKTAIDRTLAHEFDAIVTGPIAKSAWHEAGYTYPGQTEVLAEAAGVEGHGMLFVARSPHTDWTLRVLLATTHIPLAEVTKTLTPTLMSQKLALLISCLAEDFGITQPRIAIAGLNPHSGEAGRLGTEEQTWLIPWIEGQRFLYPQASLEGPIPADTLWVKPGRAWYNPPAAHDAYLALYHDQGLIPVKMLAFDRAINTTISLPFIRTSPDHGTAFDIAGKGIADASSMRAALELAIELANTRANQVTT
jgi:4-hydroxythreonine-4-phosphate dehydrogenase